ncbi:hypothetical protein AB6A40_003229 [Gnathostoma spinigerum]|uniref:Uncharacterized protein n=1 Tax=Gnathostoma spinigerum TaxID=75299 RepID=A0ABD6E8X3_9BILA
MAGRTLTPESAARELHGKIVHNGLFQSVSKNAGQALQRIENTLPSMQDGLATVARSSILEQPVVALLVVCPPNAKTLKPG